MSARPGHTSRLSIHVNYSCKVYYLVHMHGAHNNKLCFSSPNTQACTYIDRRERFNLRKKLFSQILHVTNNTILLRTM